MLDIAYTAIKAINLRNLINLSSVYVQGTTVEYVSCALLKYLSVSYTRTQFISTGEMESVQEISVQYSRVKYIISRYNSQVQCDDL